MRDVFKKITVKDLLSVFIMVFGLHSLIYAKMSDVTQTSLVGILILVCQYYFGSSSGSQAKDKLLQEKSEKQNQTPE